MKKLDLRISVVNNFSIFRVYYEIPMKEPLYMTFIHRRIALIRKVINLWSFAILI